MRGDVGGSADLRLVPADQDAVPGGHEVRLDEVGTQPGGQFVGGQGVLRTVAGRSSMPDHQCRAALATAGAEGARRGDRRGYRGEERDGGERRCDDPREHATTVHKSSSAAATTLADGAPIKPTGNSRPTNGPRVTRRGRPDGTLMNLAHEQSAVTISRAQR